MLAGTPVLISDQTPWIDLEDKQLGWAIPLDEEERFIRVIKEIGKMDKEELRDIKEKVRENILSLDIDKTISSTREMFKSLVN